MRDRYSAGYLVGEVITWIVGADRLVPLPRTRAVAPLEIYSSLPRGGECTRVLDRERHLDVLAAIVQPVALNDMQLPGVWGAVAVDRGAVIQPDSIDHQSVAILVMTNRFTVHRVFRVLAVGHIQIHTANLSIALPHDPDLPGALDKNHRLAGI